MTAINAPIDLLIDGRFNPPALVKDEQVLIVHPDMEVPLTTASLGLVGIEAGNTGYTQAAVDMVESQADDIVADLIRQKQSYTYRAGANARRNRGQGWWWW